MSLLAKRLRDRGYQIYNFGYPSYKNTISEASEELHIQIQKHLPKNSRLNFVTHSLGSIVTRHFATTYGAQHDLHRVVMLGPPNQGSSFAKSIRDSSSLYKWLGPAFSELCELEMPTATELLEIGIIAGGTKGGKGVSPFVSGNNDGIVSLQETRLKGAKDFIVLNGLHSFLMYRKEIFEQTVHFLENGQFFRGNNHNDNFCRHLDT